MNLVHILVFWPLATSTATRIIGHNFSFDSLQSGPVLYRKSLIKRASPKSSAGSPTTSPKKQSSPGKSSKKLVTGYKNPDYSKPRSNSAETKRAEILERRRRQQFSSTPESRARSNPSRVDTNISQSRVSGSRTQSPRRSSSLPPRTSGANLPHDFVGIPSRLSPLRLSPTRQRSIQYNNEKRLDEVRMEHFSSEHDGKKAFRDPSQYE